MEPLRTVLDKNPLIAFQESLVARAYIAMQIRHHFGRQELNVFSFSDLRTFDQWMRLGYWVKPRESAIRAIVFERTIDIHDQVIRKVPKRCYLFHPLQVFRKKLLK